MSPELRDAAARMFRAWLDLNHDARRARFSFEVVENADPVVTTEEVSPFRPELPPEL